MDRNEHVSLATVLDFLEHGNLAAGTALLRDLVHPGQERPEGTEYPKWVDHPTGEEPSQVAHSSDQEQQLRAQWEDQTEPEEGKQKKTETQSAGPLPAPGTSVPPLPGDTKRAQQPEFPAKDDIRPNAKKK